MGEVCSRFEKLAAWSDAFLNNDYASVQRCGMALPPESITGPLPLQQFSTSFPPDLPVIMKGGGVAFPTKDIAACEGQAQKLVNGYDVAAGKSRTTNFRCMDQGEEKVLVDFSVTKSCEAGQDPAKAASCNTTVTRKPDAARP